MQESNLDLWKDLCLLLLRGQGCAQGSGHLTQSHRQGSNPRLQPVL
jgi:hypothetical protein